MSGTRAARPDPKSRPPRATEPQARRGAARDIDGPMLAARLQGGASALGIALSEPQGRRLIAYVALLARWGAVYNLTAIREPRRMIDAHVLDCLAAWPVLQALLGGQGSSPPGAAGAATILDVGSGAGLPGIVWAVMLAETCPQATVTLLDAVDKKTAFQQQARAALGLHNLQCVQARIEQWESPPFDVVCSRAYATLAEFVDGTGRLLKAGGHWLAMKGAVPEPEIAALPKDIGVEQVVRLQVPGLDGAARCVVVLQAAGPGPTPASN